MFLGWWSIINHLLSTAIKTVNRKYFGVTIFIFRDHVTSSEHDYGTRREHFPIGGQWWPCIYLARIRRYGASKILGVTSLTLWGHVTSSVTWSFDSACGFVLVVHCNHVSILHRYGDMEPQRYWGHYLDRLGSRDVIGHVTICFWQKSGLFHDFFSTHVQFQDFSGPVGTLQ